MTKKLLFISMLLLATVTLFGQAKPAPIDKHQQQKVLEKLASELSQSYVDQEVAKSVFNVLANEISSLKEQPVDPVEFATRLTQKLQKQTNDLHLRVDYFPNYSSKPDNKNDSDFASDAEGQMWHSQNMGFKKVERLPFNIGLIKLDAFAPLKYASPLIASSFNFVSHTDALVIDLRGNFGGYEHTAPLLASYLLDKKTHLFNMYHRKNDTIEKRWSHAMIDGPRYNKENPVYVLVDKNTFSAGETLAYTLKHLGRVTIVGETTAGASNAGEEIVLDKDFIVFMPTKQMINPITKTNFEKRGVIPDIKVNSAIALETAQTLYLESLLKEESSERRKQRISKRLLELNK